MKTLLTLILAALCSITTNASEANANEDVTIGAGMGFTQRQVLPNGYILHQGTLLRFSLDAEMHKWGIYAHVLTQKGIDTDYHGEEQEVDTVIGFTRKFLQHFRFDTNIMFDHNTQNEKDDFFRFHLKVGWDTGESRRDFRISPYVSVTSFAVCDGKSKHVGSGHLFSVGVENIWRITKRLSISMPLALSYDTGIAHAKPGAVMMAAVGMQYKCTDRITLEVNYTGYFGHEKTTFWATMFRWHF